MTQLRNISPKEFINLMLDAYIFPVTNLDMSTFGKSSHGMYYACIGINVILKTYNLEPKDYILEKGFDFAKFKQFETERNTRMFLAAVDDLRMAHIKQCNMFLHHLNIPQIQTHKFKHILPELHEDIYDEDVDIFRELAEIQKGPTN